MSLPWRKLEASNREQILTYVCAVNAGTLDTHFAHSRPAMSNLLVYHRLHKLSDPHGVSNLTRSAGNLLAEMRVLQAAATVLCLFCTYSTLGCAAESVLYCT